LEALREFAPLQDRIEQEHDRYLYERVRLTRSLADCEKYLNDAPRKSMQQSVEQFKEYLEALEKPLNVTLELRILWDRNYYPAARGVQGQNVIDVWLDGTKVATGGPIGEDPGEKSGKICEVNIIEEKLQETFELRVRIVEKDLFFDDEGGEGAAFFTLKDLSRKDGEIPLSSADFSNVQNRAIFSIISGFPNEPELPPWTP